MGIGAHEKTPAGWRNRPSVTARGRNRLVSPLNKRPGKSALLVGHGGELITCCGADDSVCAGHYGSPLYVPLTRKGMPCRTKSLTRKSV
jgi:hypothetical protein